MTSSPTNDVPTLALLAGGRGARMGGPKSDLVLRGMPVLQYLHRRFAWRGPTLLITAPGVERPPGWELFGRELVDPVEGQGPLRGVHSALAAAETDVVVITTVDMPNVSRGQLLELAEVLAGRPDASGVMLKGDQGQIEPFPCALRRSLLPELERRISAGQLAVRSLADLPSVVLSRIPPGWPAETWLNLNRPEDVARYEEDLR